MGLVVALQLAVMGAEMLVRLLGQCLSGWLNTRHVRVVRIRASLYNSRFHFGPCISSSSHVLARVRLGERVQFRSSRVDQRCNVRMRRSNLAANQLRVLCIVLERERSTRAHP